MCDPTLLLSAAQWDELFEVQEKDDDYILVYLLTDNFKHYSAIQKFAKAKNIKIVTIPKETESYFFGDEVAANSGPIEFLELIKNAKYVITDSFHGMIFSLIYNKQFYIFSRFDDSNSNSQNSRVYQVLDELNLQYRLISYNSNKIPDTENIDYKLINEKISEIKKKSLDFLTENIGVMS